MCTIRDLYKRQGLKAFVSASVPAIGGQIFSTVTKFTLYEHLKNNKR